MKKVVRGQAIKWRNLVLLANAIKTLLDKSIDTLLPLFTSLILFLLRLESANSRA